MTATHTAGPKPFTVQLDAAELEIIRAALLERIRQMREAADRLGLSTDTAREATLTVYRKFCNPTQPKRGKK